MGGEESNLGRKVRAPVGETQDSNVLTTAHSHQPCCCSRFPEWDVKGPAAAHAEKTRAF